MLRFAHQSWRRSDGMFSYCACSGPIIFERLDRYVTSGVRDPWFTSGRRG